MHVPGPSSQMPHSRRGSEHTVGLPHIESSVQQPGACGMQSTGGHCAGASVFARQPMNCGVQVQRRQKSVSHDGFARHAATLKLEHDAEPPPVARPPAVAVPPADASPPALAEPPAAEPPAETLPPAEPPATARPPAVFADACSSSGLRPQPIDITTRQSTCARMSARSTGSVPASARGKTRRRSTEN